MLVKNKISELIKQQFTTEYSNNYFAHMIHNWAASEISDTIALCITGNGNCQIKYINIAKSFGITKGEIEQGDIASIKNKIESEVTKESSEFSELISRFDQSLKERSEASIIQILNSSAEEMLNGFCRQYHSTVQENDLSQSTSEEDEFVVLPEGPTEVNSASSTGEW